MGDAGCRTRTDLYALSKALICQPVTGCLLAWQARRCAHFHFGFQIRQSK